MYVLTLKCLSAIEISHSDRTFIIRQGTGYTRNFLGICYRQVVSLCNDT